MPSKKKGSAKSKSAADAEKEYRKGIHKQPGGSIFSKSGQQNLRIREIGGAMAESRRRGENPMSVWEAGESKTKIIDKNTGKVVYPRKKK